MTPEEIQRVFAEYSETLKTGGTVSAEMAMRMKDASKGVKGYADAQANLTKVLTKSIVEVGKAMYEGKQGAQVFTEQISQVTDAIAGLLAVVSLFVPALRLAAVVAGGLSLFGKAVNVAAKQQDQLFKTFQELSRSGMASAQGMSEVFPTMQKFGYGLEDLDKMIQLVRENSADLGRFAPTVAQGIQQVANVATEIQHSGLQGQFMRMGMSVDDINKGIMGYVKMQGQLGQLQGKTQAEVSAGAKAYIREMEILSRLTGQRREELEKERDAANQIEIFYSTIKDLDPKAQKRMYDGFLALNAISPRLGKAMADTASGLVGASDEASELFMATNGASVTLGNSLRDGTINLEQYLEGIKAATLQTEETRTSLGQLGAAQDVYGKNIDYAILQGKEFAKGLKDATSGVDANAAGSDKQTASQVALRQSQMSARDSLQQLGDTVGKKTTPIMEGFGKAVQGATGLLTGGGPAGGAQGPMGGQKGSLAGSLGATAAGAAAGAMGGSLFGPIGTVVGGVGGGILGAMGYGGFGGGGGGAPADLRIKPGAENKGKSTDTLYGVANEVHKMLGGDYKYFSGFNDRSGGKHGQGKAFDLVLNDRDRYQSVLSQIQGLAGVSFAQFEPQGFVNKNGSISSGDHIHTEVSAANGAILSGPMSGYKPNLTMHGTEAIVPLNSSNAGAISGLDASSKLETLMTGLNEQMDAQTRVMRDIADYTKKTSQYAGV